MPGHNKTPWSAALVTLLRFRVPSSSKTVYSNKYSDMVENFAANISAHCPEDSTDNVSYFAETAQALVRSTCLGR